MENKRKTTNDKIKRASTSEKNSSSNAFSLQESSSGSQKRSEFIREAIRSERNRWIEEARKKKEQFEKEEG